MIRTTDGLNRATGCDVRIHTVPGGGPPDTDVDAEDCPHFSGQLSVFDSAIATHPRPTRFLPGTHPCIPRRPRTLQFVDATMYTSYPDRVRHLCRFPALAYPSTSPTGLHHGTRLVTLVVRSESVQSSEVDNGMARWIPIQIRQTYTKPMAVGDRDPAGWSRDQVISPHRHNTLPSCIGFGKLKRWFASWPQTSRNNARHRQSR